jgi:hypothetical protein
MPGLFVVLRKAFLETSGLAKHAQFDLEIGEGEDAGRIRIVPNAKGIFGSRLLKHGTVLFDFGHIAQLGQVGHKSRDAEVSFVDGAALVTIPEWPEDDDEDDDSDIDEEDGDDEFEEPEPRKPADLPKLPLRDTPAHPPAPMNGVAKSPAAKAPKAPEPEPPESPAAARRTYNGITIDLTRSREAVSFKGETMAVTPRGARLIESLARAMPNCIGEPQLIAFVWEGKPPQGASVALDLVIADLKPLRKLGLEVKNQKGIGRQLVMTA